MSTSSEEVEAEAVRLVLQPPGSCDISERAVLEFCCANPWITKHSLNFGPTKKDRNYILQKMLENGASLEFITEFCETFYPNEAAFPEMEGGGGVLFAPLHLACSQKNIAEGIIPYLPAKYPNEASKRHTQFPLHSLVDKRNLSLENYQALCNCNCEAVTEYAVQTAFSKGMSPVMEFLAPRAPTLMAGVWFYRQFEDGEELMPSDDESLSKIARALSLLPNHVQFLDVPSFLWEKLSWRTEFLGLLGSNQVRFRTLYLHTNMQNILDDHALGKAIASNTTVQRLTLHLYSGRQHSWSGAFLSDVADALKRDNTTLSSIHLYSGRDRIRPWYCENNGDVGKKIDFYLSLNRHGRRAARDPGSSKAELVENIAGVRSWWENEYAFYTLNVYFCLLRECPDKWTNGILDATTTTSLPFAGFAKAGEAEPSKKRQSREM